MTCAIYNAASKLGEISPSPTPFSEFPRPRIFHSGRAACSLPEKRSDEGQNKRKSRAQIAAGEKEAHPSPPWCRAKIRANISRWIYEARYDREIARMVAQSILVGRAGVCVCWGRWVEP